MISAPLPAATTSTQVWNLIESDVTLRHSRMTRGWNERLQGEKLGLNAEQRKRKNGAYYLPARVDLEIKHTDERAQGLYAACCEVGDIHGTTRDRAFFRAVFDHCLTPLFATRRSCLQAELIRRDEIMRTPGSCSAALDHFARQMDKLRADWNTRLEIETRDCETRERVARERAILLPAIQAQSAPAFMNREGDGSGKTLKIEQVREGASDFSWKELEIRFRDIQAKAPGQKVSADFIRTEWDSGSVSDKWIVSGNPICQNDFEDLASIAARKLGCATTEDTNTYWLDRVRQWMGQTGLDKDRSVAWCSIGTVSEWGKSGTTQGLVTERIAELSARFCVNLISRGIPESVVSQPATAPTHQKMGRKAKRPPDFTALAGILWNGKKGPTRGVSDESLKEIGDELDSRGFTPPAKYLEGKAAKELKARNSKTANSKNGGAIRTWSALVTRGDKDELTAMRRLLIRCASKQP